ncbi:hypothetical protein Hjap01_00118 [Haloarcula japonica]
MMKPTIMRGNRFSIRKLNRPQSAPYRYLRIHHTLATHSPKPTIVTIIAYTERKATIICEVMSRYIIITTEPLETKTDFLRFVR